MFPDRPDVDEYIRLLDAAADLKDESDRLEYELKSLQADFVFRAVKDKRKSKEVEEIKFIGNDEVEREKVQDIKARLYTLQNRMRHAYNKCTHWEAKKALYVSDNYHRIQGSVKALASQEGDD